MNERYYEDYEPGEARDTTGRTITEADIVLHGGQTGDLYPHHFDAEWCATQPFGRRIAHGTLVFGIAVGMTAGAINPLAMTYGYDRLRFVRPVFIGDTLTSRIEVTEKRDHKKPDHGIVTERLTTTNQAGETVMVCDHLLLVTRRERGT